MPHLSVRPSAAPGILLGLALLLSQPRAARAENSVSYKYEDYRESDGRIVVKTQNALVEQDLGPDMHLKVQGVIDAIAGATPNGQPAPAGSDQVPLTNLTEHRKAWNADFARQFAPMRLELGVANSRESDYVSTGWSANTLTDFNQKNTTLLVGAAGTDDDVKVFYQTPWAKKRSNDLIAGVTQLLDPQTAVTFNLTWGHANGYLNDQYKLVEKRMEVAPGVFLPFTFGENRPDTRTRWIALAAVNRAFPEQHGAIDASYRFYHDTFGTDAHTIEIHWLQHLGQQVILEPEFRWYDQTAADFYHYRLDDTAIVPVSGPPQPQGPFYSSDYRLSSLRTTLVGLKAVWTPAPHWQLDAALERYDMRGNDGRTPQSAYPRATMITGGARFSW
ncbi:MAG TPA: DUF3570 domain-containing protein [Lacunisphaera sp.]|nr:DUF3570 domain-containing protein [Lacunisphaera sp.]